MQKIIIICGPTASGKTGLALELCRRFNGEMVSADSQQVYRGMDIGTAKDDITAGDIPCHLVDIADPDEVFDASKFQELAEKAIAKIASRGNIPFVVGGTGLYIKALIEGLCDAPGRDEALRAELSKFAEEKGRGALHDILRFEDPEMGTNLHPNDITRVIRAIEVKRLTGLSLLKYQKQQPPSPHGGEGRGEGGHRYTTLKLALNIDRTELYERINARVDNMIERGLVDEVKKIVEKYGSGIQSLKAVGYKEIALYLNGAGTLNEAIELTKRNTRRFAKRQLTWFSSDRSICWFDQNDMSLISEAVSAYVI